MCGGGGNSIVYFMARVIVRNLQAVHSATPGTAILQQCERCLLWSGNLVLNFALGLILPWNHLCAIYKLCTTRLEQSWIDLVDMTSIHENLVLILFLSQGRLYFSDHLHMRMVQKTSLTWNTRKCGIYHFCTEETSPMIPHVFCPPAMTTRAARRADGAALSLIPPWACVKLRHNAPSRHTYRLRHVDIQCKETLISFLLSHWNFSIILSNTE